jgi:transposase
MRLKTVFTKLLALQGARVIDAKFDGERLVVSVERCGRLHRCPVCGSRGPGYDHRQREWRHLSLGKWAVFISAEIYRVSCPKHGVLQEAVPWAGPGAEFTLDFEELVAWLAREMNKTAVARYAHIAWETVGSIVKRIVARKLDPNRLNDLYVIGLDEVSYRKGHKYLTVVASHHTGKPVFIEEGRSKKTVGRFFDQLGEARCKKLEVVTMDMSEAFISEVRARVPHAIIAFDPFHVVKLAGEAVHQLRRAEARDRKGTTEAAVLKGSRWALLKSPENLRPEEKLHLAEVARINSNVYRGYLLKEELRALYWCGPRAAKRHLAAWLAWASRSRLEPFVKLARTLRRHRMGILAAIRMGVSNGRLEGINNKIGVIKHRAYGFHSAAALIAMVFLCCGDVPLALPI